MKILIHACSDRIFFVTDFIIPKLIESGVPKEAIYVHEDTDHTGCLRSYIASFDALDLDGDTWHLQDDVLPRKDFGFWVKGLENFPGGIICGYGNKEFYMTNQFGYAKDKTDMFYSFPCLRISNKIAHEFVDWFNYQNKLPLYQEYIVHNKFVDFLFKEFIGDNPKQIPIFNLKPCLVEHVDEYCNGSLVNKSRGKPSKALYFNDHEALDELCKWYKNQKRYGVVRHG